MLRRVFVCVSLGFLAGCATVSMVPGETTVTSGLSQSQSDLKKLSSEYCDAVVEAGWVRDNGGLAALADTLMNGKSDAAEKPETYADSVDASKAAPAIVVARISSDVADARTGLENVSAEARKVLVQTDSNANRSDVMSYERALVRAQMAYRSFQGALGEVSARGDMDIDTQALDAELGEFADTIDDARKTADSLADKYASLRKATS